MILTVFRVTALRLLRDRGALALAFVLPPLIFVVFAAIFASTAGADPQLRVAVVDQVGDARSQRLIAALARGGGLSLQRLGPDADEARLRRLVQAGRVDAGILIRGPLDGATATGPAPLHLLADRAKAATAPMAAARLQAALGAALPELGLRRTLATAETLVGGYTHAQRRHLEAALRDPGPPAAGTLVSVEALAAGSGADDVVSYYAGAIAVLFLLFTSMQAATGLIDERDCGLIDRILLGPGGSPVIVLGKGLFLLVQGTLQVTLIFLVAWLAYGVDLPAQLGPWLVTTLCAALAATGLALALATGSRTRQQAQSLTTFFVLITSAVGGSMVPRFLMPAWLQDLGWLTPNAWAVEAYQAVLWRGEPATALLPAWGVLAGVGAVGTGVALALAQRLARI